MIFSLAWASASAMMVSTFSSASATIWSAIRWAESMALRMASSVERYSSILSASTFILAFSVAFSLYKEV